MTKEEWEKYKTQEEWSLYVYYSYYKDNGGTFPEDIFNVKFPQFISQHQQIPYMSKNKGFVIIKIEEVLVKIYDFYDRKFNI